jgi:dihydrofolate reductase
MTSPDPQIEVVTDDPVTFLRVLKSEDGKDIWLCGGGELAGALWSEIDEVVVKLNPLTAGEGIPLARRPYAPSSLTLVSARPMREGVVLLRYTRTP